MAWYDYIEGGSGGAVSSVFTRTGDVVAEANDYTTDLIGNDSILGGVTLTDSLDRLSFQQSTAWQQVPTISINGGDATQFDLGVGKATFVNTSGVETITDYAGATGITATEIANGLISYVYMDSTGTIQQTLIPPDTATNRDRNYIGVLVHTQGIVIESIVPFGLVNVNLGQQLNDIFALIGNQNVNGNDYQKRNDTDLTILKNSGRAFSPTGNSLDLSDPNYINSGSISPVTWNYYYRKSGGGWNVDPAISIVDVAQYDDGSGTLQAVPSNRWTIQVVRFFPDTDLTVLTYGQALYNSFEQAEAGITDAVEVPAEISAGIVRAYIVVRGNATNFSDPTTNKIFEATENLFGANVAENSTNLQRAYNNSTNPEIITDAIRGALSVQEGTGTDTNNVFEGRNNAGTLTFEVTGEGNITANEVNGIALTSSGGGTNYLADDGTYKAVSGGAGIAVYSPTIADAENTIAKTAILTQTLDANTINDGDTFQIELIIEELNNTGGNETINIDIEMGATNIYGKNYTLGSSATVGKFKRTFTFTRVGNEIFAGGYASNNNPIFRNMNSGDQNDRYSSLYGKITSFSNWGVSNDLTFNITFVTASVNLYTRVNSANMIKINGAV